VLSTRAILKREGVELLDVACRHERGRGRVDEQALGHAIVFVRRGCFVRSADGVETLLDPTVAYCMNPGEEQRYDHPHGHGDDCTAVFLAPGLLASLTGGEEMLPAGPVPTSPEIDLEHRLLLAAGRRDDDPHEVVERAAGLAARALEHADPRRIAARRPATARSWRALADGVREALAEDVDRSLSDLTHAFSVSPHHLSRVFRSVTGHTIARHRLRLRARAALERLSGGERNLARLAADVGFADQSHLCRVVRGETGTTPAVLRRTLMIDAPAEHRRQTQAGLTASQKPREVLD
jgi:AraC-like DNA-binding protein